MGNHEERNYDKSVNVYLALSRTKDKQKSRCIRLVDKGIGNELEILKAQLKVIGGCWRIHKTVNARDTEKARKHLLSKLINHPEKASCIDTEWRTALLQKECIYGEKRFMLDIDTKDLKELEYIDILLAYNFCIEEIEKHKTPNGWHYITKPFDTRTICELKHVTLLRDGYYFIESINI